MTTPDNSQINQNNPAGEHTTPAPALPSPIDQAMTLLTMLSRGERIMQQPTASTERNHSADCTLALCAVGIAIAHELRRLADALKGEQP